jgi:histidine kinase family protein
LVLSIRAKLVIPVVATVVVAAAGSGLLIRQAYGRTAHAVAAGALRSASAAYDDLERSEVGRLMAILDMLAANGPVRDAFAARDRERLQALAQPIGTILRSDHGISHFAFLDAETRRVFLRPDQPSRRDEVVSRPALLRAMARKENSVGKEIERGAFALRVARPLFGSDARLLGYVEVGADFDRFLTSMKKQTGNDYALFVQKGLLDEAEWTRTRGSARNGWADLKDAVVTNGTSSDPMVDEAALGVTEPAGRILGELEKDGATFARAVFPVKDSSGAVVGGLVVRHDVTALRDEMRTGALRALGLLLLLAVLSSILVHPILDRLVFGRLRTMMETMQDMSVRLAGGDYSVGNVQRKTADDEIGGFEAFFGDFLRLVGNTLSALAERRQQPRPAPPPAAPRVK